ncbi:phenylalanine--tRNA ligase subunit beta [Nocardioides sp. GY 10127]|uniref:phenylalanine--tRNA ligase subunit beta n=1 Tax=Nocardioides sp. GY 10127 TaxID=2569762 RepID=UPI0010A8675B|nr:phenylalanine--tRNA ligase subunit beta [Nocardioides sp. GY 10127]TIC78706.1 phenylalanine--tRNA ligase subunit beta [Nocardioides sp. GY 10127]TIC81054.1 phenylalanine--tRNA ligase subunit beta [Nocardioides sp. GY 10127]
MKAPVSWIREYVDLPAEVTTEALTDKLTLLGLKLEAIESPGAAITGPLVVGRVLTQDKEPQKNGKTINWCTVDVGDANGTGEPQGIVCGAHNFGPGDLVCVVLPGGVLPGGFAISARKTYGHVSAGMICSAAELGLPEDAFGGAGGIIVLPADTALQPGSDVRPLLGLDEEIIEFEVNPDRAYGLSLRGIARDAALGFSAPFSDPCDRVLPAADDAGHPVVVEDEAGCPVFVARTVAGFDPTAETPDWMASRLTAAGMRPISLAVDVTNYVMLETGRPIHGYDAEKVAGALRVRRATVGEKLTTLDGTARVLSEQDLVIADDSGPIGLAGVMGGETTEMSASTTRVLVESAHWEPVSMFRTGKRHKISSEAGKRNERGADPASCEAAADRVVELLCELGGATAEPGVTVVGSVPAPSAITIAADLPQRVAGLPIDTATAVAALEGVGCTVTLVAEVGEDGVPTNRLVAVPPTWRPDVTDPFDLVEEVLRVVGYDQVPSVLPREAAGRGLTRSQRLRRRVGRTLAGAGLSEVVCFPFVGQAAFDKLGLEADDPRRSTVRLANPLSNEEPEYTTTLLPNLLGTAARNVARGAAGAAVFETATVAIPREGAGPAPIYPTHTRPTEAEVEQLFAALPAQPLHLGVVLAGERERAGWWGEGRAADWADAIAVARRLATELGVDLEVVASVRQPWHPGRCAALRVGGRTLGHAGELHPRVVKAFDLPARAAALELDLDALMAAAPERAVPPTLSTYPVAKEDVALVVAEDVPAAQVEAALREGAGELLESIRLFDVYRSEQLGSDRKSLAFALRLRAGDRTLTDDEVKGARDGAVALAAERCGATQR